MPATQRGQAIRLGPNRWALRWWDHGHRRRKSPFRSKSAALAHFRDVIEPQLRGDPARRPDLTLSQFTPLFLERHKVNVRPKTIVASRERMRRAEQAFGT